MYIYIYIWLTGLQHFKYSKLLSTEHFHSMSPTFSVSQLRELMIKVHKADRKTRESPLFFPSAHMASLISNIPLFYQWL